VPIAFAPTAPLVEDAFAGDTILTIQDIPGEWGALIGERIEEWFATGDKIVVAPGESNQEVRTLVGVDPLHLDRPLDFDHRIDTIVSIVPPGMIIEDRSEIASELKAIAEDDHGITLVWSATPGLWYQLEVEASPGQWVVLQDSLYAGTVALPTSLLWNDYDPAANYRLARGRPGEIPLEIFASDPDPVTGLASLVWPLGNSDSYLIDVSPSLQPDSWGTLSTDITFVDQHGVASVPLSPDSSSRFYRVRSSSSPVPEPVGTIVTMQRDPQSETVLIGWIAEPFEEHLLESAPYDDPQNWKPEGGPIIATNSPSFISMFILLSAVVSTSSVV